ncbi:MAG TPA: dihydroorotate dehydrogenase electron transfer subunit [Clostridiaceae bacterium]|jgi:dihydroorotate dehydrogenase electron transfer subunit|nr:dihydroorotate dehydrogenase electron transfer subunit [Clostridiaceae bacterium]
MNKEYTITLRENLRINPSTHWLSFYCPDIACQSMPGQFVSISSNQFLKRPFGIAQVDKDKGTFSIGVRVVKDGTRYLTTAPIGTEFEVLGPLGHGFPIHCDQPLLLVGGGTGIFPLRFLQNYAQENDIPYYSVNGFRCVDDACFIDSELTDNCLVATDAGDFGVKGNVLDALDTIPFEKIRDSVVCAVGPEIMMKNVALWAESKGLVCYVSLEKRMACGIGICLVCTCKTKSDKDPGYENKRCCKDGPVFLSTEVIW